MTRMRQFIARHRPPLRLLGLAALVAVAATPWAWATLPNPEIATQYDVFISSGEDFDDFSKTLLDLNVGVVHHLDVDGDGGAPSTGCADYLEFGEVAGRCETNPDITLKTTIESSFGSLLTVPTKAPVVRINRAPSAVIEGRPAPPLRIVAEFTVTDTHDIEPDTFVRFGYETPPGGTIPARLTGVVGGLEPPTLPPPEGWQPFNPVEILLDSGQFTTLSGVAGVPPTYSGPLTVLGGVTRNPTPDSEQVVADVAFAYKPLPERIRVKWTRDDARHRNLFTYEHDAPGLWEHADDPDECPSPDGAAGCPRDVDVTATLQMTVGDAPEFDDNEHLDVTASVDRLPATPLVPNNPDGSEPPRVTMDVTSLVEEGKRLQGTADLRIPVAALSPSGTLPDASIRVVSRKPSATEGGEPDVQVISADVEQIPNSMHAEWYLPVKPTATNAGCTTLSDASLPGFVDDPCLAEALFEVLPVPGASAPHVGGLQLSVANYENAPAAFTPHVPEREQYVSLQSGPVTPGSPDLQQLLTARVERIRRLSFAEQADGFDAHARVGDGASPLELHVGTDERTRVIDAHGAGTADDEFGQKRDLRALLLPLPNDLSIDVQLPDETAARPLTVTWDARITPDPDDPVDPAELRRSVDLDADVEVRERDAADGAECGEPFTLCASATMDHIPLAGTVTLDRRDDETLLKVDTVRPSGTEAPPAPDIVADFQLRPTDADAPLVGRVDIRRLPRHVTARALTPLLPAEQGAAPERGLTRLQLHPCDYDFATRTCAAGAGEKFGALTFAVRDFLKRPELPPDADPPDRVPLHVPITTTPTYLAAAVRDGAVSADVSPVTDTLLFEVEGHFTEVAEIQYLNPGNVVGGRIRAGDGVQPFTVAVDVGAVQIEAGGNPADLRATALLHSLPTQVDVCFRGASEDVPEPGAPFDPEITAVCEADQPFGAEHPVDDTPMSLALDANDEFVLDVDFTKVDRGRNDAAATDDATVAARLHVEEVPRTFAAHVQTPPDEGEGPLRALFDAAESPDAVTVDFAAEVRDGDLFCTDARVPRELAPAADGSRQFQDVLCIEGRIDDLPTRAFLAYDPTATANNFHFDHNGGTDVDLRNLLLTRVGGDLEDRNVPKTPDDESDDAPVADILVVEGFLEGLPPLVEGDLVLPGTVELRSVDSPGSDTPGAPVKRVHVTAKNFILPDPMPDTIPTQRRVDGVDLPGTGLDACADAPADASGGIPPCLQRLIVLQRDDLFKATVDVTTLVKAGFATARDVDGNLLDTNVITVDFGRRDDVVRAYADLQLFTEEDDPATDAVDERLLSLETVIGDVTLTDKPAGITVCFRGEQPQPGVPVKPTFCDTEPAGDEGAFQFLGRPFPEATDARLDIDAFVRYGKAGGTDVLAASAHVDNVPLVVQGTFGGDGRIDVGGFDLNSEGTGAGAIDGIDGIAFELANFDLDPVAHGYGDGPPWGNSAPGFEEGYSRARLSDHFARVNVHDELFFLQGRLGVPDPACASTGECDRVPDSELQRVFVSSDHCPVPDSAPGDYPHFPRDVNSSYTCIRGEFEQVGGGAASPLLAEITVDKDGERFTLNGPRPDGSPARAGLTRVPDAFQATFAKTVKLQADGALRRPCGPANVEDGAVLNCMPPLLRLDVEAAQDPAFFGVIETGTLADLKRLRGSDDTDEDDTIVPIARIAGADGAETLDGQGLAEAPDADGFDAWPGGHGARVRLGKLAPAEGEPASDGTTIVAGLHLPVTASLTVDQLQTWDCEDGKDGCPDVEDPFDNEEDPAKAKDIRIHYTARGDDGAPVASIGQLALMIVDKGEQILLADPDDAENAGITMPGELGLSLYQRDGWDPPADDQQRSRKFMQIDGRISHPTAIGARIFGDAVGVLHAKLKGMPTVPAGDDDPLSPSFRLRLGVDDLKSADDGPDGIIETILDFLSFDFDLGDAKGSCDFDFVLPKCTLTDIQLNEINATIDFSGAKRVDAYVTLDKPQNGIELRGYDELHGTADAAPVTIDATVTIDPLFVFFHFGIPVIASADLVLIAEAEAELDFTTAEQARWRNDLTRVKLGHDGDSGGASVDLSITPIAAGGLVTIVIPVIVPFYIVWGFTYAWIPAVGPPVDVTYIDCGFGVPEYDPSSNRHSIGAGEDEDVYADLSLDPRMIQYGSTDLSNFITKGYPNIPTGIPGVTVSPAPLMTMFSFLTGCVFASADIDLIAGGSQVGPAFTVATHPVHDFDAPVDELPPPPPPPPPPPSLEVSGTQAMCGRVELSSLTVLDGGTVTVGSTAGPYCSGSAGDSGRLQLVAQTVTVRSGGLIDARGASGPVELFAGVITVQGSTSGAGAGRVLAATQPLHLRGLRHVQIDGRVVADGVASATSVGGSAAATGNSGAGHGAAGGDGSTGTGGAAFGDPSLEADTDTGLLPSETGTRGAGPGTPGRGGGRLHLSGHTVRISGTVDASGAAGSSDTSGACAVPDNPQTEETNEAEPNTGRLGSGGGSGGTIAISAQVVDTSGGTVSVRGGAGGSGKAGGGGGGAAGVAKVVAPVFVGNAIQTTGGAGGGNGGCPESDRGDAGGSSAVLSNHDPSSWAAPTAGDGFTGGDDLAVPFAAAANEVDGSDDFQVVLCGLHRPPEAAEKDEPKDAENKYGIDVPASSSRSVTRPCGTDTGDTTTHVLGSTTIKDATEAPEGSTIQATPVSGDSVRIDDESGNGWWGIYTVVLKPRSDGNDCLDADSPFELFFDQSNCIIESLPPEPDVVVGIDNTPPEIASFSAPATATSESIQLSISGVSDKMPRQTEAGEIANTSGIARLECSNDAATWERCGVGIVDWELPPGSGPKTVHVRATDVAGNETVVTFDLTLDVTPPASQAEPVPSTPDGSHGWYRTAPSFRLHGFSDQGGSGPGQPAPYEYWFDGGTHRRCDADDIADASNPECLVDDGLPGIGTHTFHWQAVDRAGHRQPVQSAPFRVDGAKPEVELLTAPFAPDADNGWFGLQPFAVVSAFDQPSGSGLEPVNDTDTQTGVFLAVDSVIDEVPGTFARHTEPLRLGPGTHELCFFARDAAGNVSDSDCEAVLVDDEQPTVAISTTPPAADGTNEWFVSTPSVTVSGADASSTVDAAFDGTADLCGALPARPDPATPSGTCVSYDGAAYVPFTAPHPLTDEGTHVVRAFSVDVAGKRSAPAELVVRVDTAAPATLLRTEPPAPALQGRFRRIPTVALAAAEPQADNAGVDGIEYRIDGGPWTPYSTPFPVTDGRRTIDYRAFDLAGNVEEFHTRVLVVDTTPPGANADSGSPNPWNRPTPPTASLSWSASDTLSDTAHTSVLVFGAELPAQSVVLLRRVEHTPDYDPSPSFAGTTPWDGNKEVQTGDGIELEPVLARVGCTELGCLPGGPPLSGRYWFHIVVTDEAGNVTQTDESAYLQVNL